MNASELFLGGMVTGALLCLAIVSAFYLRPRVERRRRCAEGDGVRRAMTEAYDAGRARGREETMTRLQPRPVLTLVSRGERGWMGSTRGAEPLIDRGEGAA
jgi:hypothetical protein